jgi:hypothetical protein
MNPEIDSCRRLLGGAAFLRTFPVKMDNRENPNNQKSGSYWPVEVLDPMRELAANSRESAAKLRKQAEDAMAIAQVWTDLLKFIDSGWDAHIASLLSHQNRLLEKLRTDGHPASAAIEAIRGIAEQRATDSQKRFPRLLERACAQAELPLDHDSPHPRYSFANHFFSLQIDDQRRLARLSNSEGDIAQLPSDIPAIVELVTRERHRLFDRPFNAARFLKQLRAQYLAVAKQAGQPDGTSIPIRQITRRLGKNVRNFKTDEFLVDLSRLVEKGRAEIDDRLLDLQQTKDTRQGMLIPGPASRGYVGFVIFTKVNQ